MDILERREHDGTWWGRTSGGEWFRWSASTNAWEGPLPPPWRPEQPAMTPEEEDAIVAAALATTTAPPEGPPMNRIDRWWNRTFPPFSKKRLVFGLAVLPLFGGLQELVIGSLGWNPSLPRYLFVCIAGGVLLSTAFLPGMRDMAERLAKARGTGSPWGWPRRREPSPPQPAPPPMETTFGRDFLIALPFALVIVLVMSLTVAGVDDSFAPSGLLTNTLAALFTAALVALRTSVWGLALFSIAGGLLGGLSMVILSAMTLSDPGGDFLIGWAIGSVLLFLYAYPMWRWLRNLEARGFRLPMWLVMGGSVLLVSGAALVFVAGN